MSLKSAELLKPGRSHTADSNRLSVLDGVRGIAILLVLLHHCVAWTEAEVWKTGYKYGVGDHLLRFIGEWSFAGVDLFFVLSGFLISGILLRTRQDKDYFKNFYLRRTLRIFPLYYLFLLFVFQILPAFCTVDIPPIVWRDQPFYWAYLGNLAMFRNPGYGNMFLAHTWSLSIEEQYYLFWPFLVRKLSEKTLKRLLVGLLIVCPLIRIALAITGNGGFRTTVFLPGRLDLFAAGSLLAIAWRDGKRISSPLAAAVLTGSILAVAVITKLHGSDLVTTAGFMALLIGATALIACALNSRNSGRSLFDNSTLRSFGKYSYSIYLFHFPALYCLKALYIGWLSNHLMQPIAVWSTLFLMLACVSWMIGWFTYFAFEQHFLNLKDRFAAYSKPSVALPAANVAAMSTTTDREPAYRR